jgi:hypothetical protein
MGSATYFETEVFINRKVFSSRYELDQEIKDVEGFIESAKRELTAFSVSTPKDVMATQNEDGYVENPIDQILRRTGEIFEWMEENYFLLNRLYQFREYLEENPDKDMREFMDI